MRKKTKDEFIKESRDVHGDKYDYSNVEYVGAHTKVCIICKEHGEFWQTPSNHLSGRGCIKCRDNATGERCRFSKEDFIKRANEIHNGKYNYDKVYYINNYTKVCIICPEHGEFWQEPKHHINGCGCQKCYYEVAGDSLRFSKEDFIKRANEIHNGKYNYDKVDYKGANTKVYIVCPEHGKFWQTPNGHLQGHGCHKCGGNYSPTKEEWIAYAHEVHNSKYDYSKVEYVNSKTKVCIICKEHGKFWQTPSSHAQGVGCPKCNSSKLEGIIRKSFTESGITFNEQYRSKWLGKQSLDFYLPDYNIGIECQGLQHFEPVEHFGGEDGFKQTLERDKRKFKKCQKHRIKILYYSNIGIEYPYEVFEDVDLLFEEIKNIQVKKK